MAKSEVIERTSENLEIITLSPAETARVIAFLAAQLAQTNLPNNPLGRQAELVIEERGFTQRRILFGVNFNGYD